MFLFLLLFLVLFMFLFLFLFLVMIYLNSFLSDPSSTFLLTYSKTKIMNKPLTQRLTNWLTDSKNNRMNYALLKRLTDYIIHCLKDYLDELDTNSIVHGLTS